MSKGKAPENLKNMALFIRFSETIEEDIKRNTSILTNHNNEVVDGLCAFYGSDTVSDTVEKAKRIGKSVANTDDQFSIIEATEVWGSKTGSLGTVIENCTLISKHTL